MLRRRLTGLSTTAELLGSLWRGQNRWLVPLVIILLPAALLFILLEVLPLMSPFIYTIF